MSYTKRVEQGIDWLDHIDGLTVADAIEYLQTLESDLVLSAWIEGEDQHGIEQASEVFKIVPMNKEEIKQERIKPLVRGMKEHGRHIEYYTARGREDMVDASLKAIQQLKDKINAIENGN